MTGKTSEPDKQGEQRRQTSTDDELDKALADSFPASDPPAPAIKGTTANPKADEKKDKGGKEKR